MSKSPKVDALMAKWDDDGATRGPAFVELRDLARELEKDAARYRYLRETDDVRLRQIDVTTHDGEILEGDELDTEIDASMK